MDDGVCRIALEGSTLEIIGNGGTYAAAVHANTVVACRAFFAVNPSRLKARPLRTRGVDGENARRAERAAVPRMQTRCRVSVTEWKNVDREKAS